MRYFEIFGTFLLKLTLAFDDQIIDPYCHTKDLPLPDHGESWNCTGSSNTTVTIGDECTAVCEKNYRLSECKLTKPVK